MPAKDRRLLAVLFGTAVAVFLFASFEGAFYLANRLRPEPFVEMVVPEYKPDSTTRAAYTADGEVAYDVTYSFDERQLRKIPANPTGDADRHLYFFGGSFTFGQGVEDDETLPNYVAKAWPGTMVHNIGSPGLGTLHVYERIDMVREDLGDNGTAEIIGVYVFIPSHVNRNIGSMRVVATWAKDFPYYEFDESGSLEKRGTFTTGRPVLSAFQRLISHEQILKFFEVDLPRRTADEHLEFTARVIAECKRKFLDITGSGRFYVLLFPDHPGFEFDTSRILPFLDTYDIEFFDYRDAIDLDQPGALIPVDGHPTAATYEKLAPLLIRDLQQKLEKHN